MTQPAQPGDMTDAHDALLEIGRMLSGSKMLQQEPGVVYSLAQQKARPQDAQAIDQFMSELDAEKQVYLARQSIVAGHGGYISLAPEQQKLLDGMGVQYSDVLYTSAGAAKQTAQRVSDLTDGTQTVVLNSDGSVKTHPDGSPVLTGATMQVAGPTHHASSGWFDSPGAFVSNLGGAISGGAGAAWRGLNKGLQFGLTGLSRTAHVTESDFQHLLDNPSLGHFVTAGSDLVPGVAAGKALYSETDPTGAQDMRTQGYDPDSLWSRWAFWTSGHAHSDLTQLNDQYGNDQVDKAIRFAKDPKAYRDAIIGDQASYTTDADGRTVLTPDAEAQLREMNSKHFETLVRKLNGSDATIGNDFANTIRLDPVKHPEAYGYTAAGANLAASFAVDPASFALGGLKAAKVASLGIKTFDGSFDAEKAASILTRSSKLPWVNSVQRGWQRGIDLGKQIRQATVEGDTAKAGTLTAQFRAELPTLEPILDRFVGLHAFNGYEEVTRNGARTLVPKFEDTGGFQSLDDAANFIRHNYGLQRLMVGKAAVQQGLMPGALSAVGFRKLKGITAGWTSARAASRSAKTYGKVLSKAAVNAEFRKAWLDQGFLARLQPEADDAVDSFGGDILASREMETTTGSGALASQRRAEQIGLTRAGAGEAALNVRKSGDPTGLARAYGWASPAAFAARSRLAAARFVNLLPRNNTIDLGDAVSGQKINQWARLYLDKGTANQFEAAWAGASMGQRKVIMDGLLSQAAHASGLTKSDSGNALFNLYKTHLENYSASGNDIVLNGRKVALSEGQTVTRFSLPSFEELQRAASKLGLWDATMGRAATSRWADLGGGLWKTVLLLAPKTATRNWLEAALRLSLEGDLGEYVKVRALATMRNKEAFALGIGKDDLALFKEQRGIAESTQRLLSGKDLSAADRATAQDKLREAQRLMATVEGHPVVKHLLATEAGDRKLASEIERGSMMSGQMLGRSKLGTHIADTALLSLVGRAYASMLRRHMTAEDIDAFFKMSPDDLATMMSGYRRQMVEDAPGIGHAANEATLAAQNGFGSATLKWTIKHEVSKGEGAKKGLQKSWTLQALDDTAGADKLSNAIGRLTTNTPETARAIMRHLKVPDGELADKKSAVEAVVAALEKESRHSDFGHAFFPDPVNAPSVARTAINDEERAAGKLDWANKLIGELRYLTTGQDGQLQRKLVDYIEEHGTAPDGNWISKHLKGAERPEAALAPETMALPAGGFDKLLPALQDRTGAGFAFFVERPLQRLMSAPVLGVNFIHARKALNADVERLVAEGFSRESAENLAKDLAMRNAMVHTEQLIDDPGQKTQFDVIARNLFPFSRAVQAMIRRWGAGLWRNPLAARRLMLAYEGAVHSGMIYDNQYGEPTFTYPGSGVFDMALREIAKVPGMENIAQFPLSSSMTGTVLMSVPGADNPFRMSMGPMLSIPIREVYKHLLPTAWQGEALSLDRLVNGPIGAGQTFTQLVPSSVRRFYEAFQAPTRNSAIASAMNGALANLAAAGYVPAPEDANTPSVRNEFFDRVKTQTRNQLFLRAVLGAFAPSAPSLPEEATPGSGADFAWQFDGLKQLDPEYKAILDETGGNVAEAAAVFTALHPDKLVYTGSKKHPVWELPSSAYETSTSEMTANGGYVPSTTDALNWMTDHAPFIKRYGSVAAYFLPQMNSNEPFNDAAYQEQLQLGLRVKKVPDEFLNDVYVKHAESLFYPSVDKFDALINQAKAAGNDSLASTYTQQKSVWEKDFKALNPLFGAKLDSYGDSRKTASQQLSDLRAMVASGDVPGGMGSKLNLLLKTWDEYQAFLTAHPGGTNLATDQRHAAFDAVNRWAQQTLAGTPVANVWNGVFRVLDSNLGTLSDGTQP